MRRSFAVFAALALAVPAAAAPGTPIDLDDVRQNLFASCFPTDREGWMVGELGRILRTTDGGKSWVRQDAGTKRPFLAMACRDARTAWIAGKEGIVYGTKDGGDTWTQFQTGSNRHVFSIEFPTAERGHLVGDFGTMVHTEDGGKTWTVSRIPESVVLPDTALDTGVEPGDVNLYGMSFGDADHVWVVGEFGIIVASDDGGRTWHQQHTPIESTLFGIKFTDAKHGFAVGIDSTILATEDGGETWRTVPPPVTQRSYYDIALRGTTGWIVGDSGTVLKTTDGGATWVVEPLPIQLASNWIRTVSIAPTGGGLAVGSEGLVLRIEGAKLERLEGGHGSTETKS
ncbi:MAG TPA: YCF48-related protein [Candidatus Eisenbacteria bacterium]|nr:YCF48-related protein [Candidatus Eisenbacteria bacterium]